MASAACTVIRHPQSCTFIPNPPCATPTCAPARSGPLPGSLVSVFSNLRTLSLSGNMLNGTIPAELSRLYNLKILDLTANRLTGTVRLGARSPFVERRLPLLKSTDRKGWRACCLPPC